METIIDHNSFGTDVISNEDINRLLNNLIENKPRRIRIFVDGIKIDSKETDEIIASSPRLDERLDDWGKRVFSDRRYGIIINWPIGSNLPFISKACTHINSMFDSLRPDPTYLDCSLFMGNYSFTPSGIHKDVEIDHIVHFHLIGEKRMVAWTEEEFFSITKSRLPYLHPERILESGRSYILYPGTVYYMPAKYYHVGCNTGFSCGLAFGF